MKQVVALTLTVILFLLNLNYYHVFIHNKYAYNLQVIALYAWFLALVFAFFRKKYF